MWWLFSVWSGCTCQQPPAQRETPDVYIITVDTLRADRLGVYGYKQAHTPNLDELSKQGRTFVNATTPLPRTTPALASLQTGLQPHHHGAREVGDHITAKQSLASTLQTNGFTTIGVSAMKVAGPDQGLDLGFSSFTVDHDARAAHLASTALAAATAAPSDKPLYLWVHFADPHFPYLPPADGPLPPKQGKCLTLGNKAARGKFRRDVLFTNRGKLAENVQENCEELYDGEVAAVDSAIGNLLKGLQSARGQSAFVVFSADHGENMGEDGLFFEHGPSLSNASLRVPLIITGPKVVAGFDEGLARLQDIAPTLVSQLSIPTDQPFDGVDLSPNLLGEPGETTTIFAEAGSALHRRLHQFLVSGRAKNWCLNDAPYSLCYRKNKLVGLYDHTTDPDLKHNLAGDHPEVVARLSAAATQVTPERTRPRGARRGQYKWVERPTVNGFVGKLYDLDSDPKETTDVASQHPDIAKELAAELATWAQQLQPTDRQGRGEDELDALRELGYVE